MDGSYSVEAVLFNNILVIYRIILDILKVANIILEKFNCKGDGRNVH
jgi:hypothetical protein